MTRARAAHICFFVRSFAYLRYGGAESWANPTTRGGYTLSAQGGRPVWFGGYLSVFGRMSFDRERRGGGKGNGSGRGGRGREKEFGQDFYGGAPESPRGGGFGDRPSYGGGGGDRPGGGDRYGGGGGGGQRSGGGGYNSGGGDRGGFGGGGGGRPPRPQMPAQVVGEGTGVVKFFNRDKGFGFVSRDDGGEDVFVHISAVEQAGLDNLANGQTLAFTLVDRNGRISATDIKITGEHLTADAPSAGGGERERPARARRELTGERTTGEVKFFNGSKGFGFIKRDDGGADCFVHISALERAGFHALNEGDRVEFDIEVDDRGKYSAVNLAGAN